MRDNKRSQKSNRKTSTRLDKAIKTTKHEDDEESDEDDVSNNSKNNNRGRKLTEPNKYYFESQQKIKAWREKLKHDKTLNAAAKQKLRNQISAQ